MDGTKLVVIEALNKLIEYMTISEIAFNVMTGGNLLDNQDMRTVYYYYRADHDRLLKILVNKFG